MAAPGGIERPGAGCAGPRLAIVIPVLNDADALAVLLARLRAAAGAPASTLEVVVADGGSRDGSVSVAAAAGCRTVCSRAGRGHQLAAAIAQTRAPWLWMLHADSEPSLGALNHLLSRPADVPGWGRFDVSLAPGTALEAVAWAMNVRSRATAICTGDQGIFVHRALLDAIGGMPAQPLMEDVELSRRLKQQTWPDCRPERIATSPRRWRRDGTVRTILSMWGFRFRYWAGADAERLAREYYRA